MAKFNDPIPLPRITDSKIIRRFGAKLQIIGSQHNMWLWRGARDKQGYGRLKYKGHLVAAHRVSYAIHKGPIPEGLTVNHLPPAEGVSPVTLDCNSDHLELMTHAENVAEGNGRREEEHQVACWVCENCAGSVFLIKEIYECFNCGAKSFHTPELETDSSGGVPF